MRGRARIKKGEGKRESEGEGGRRGEEKAPEGERRPS